MTLSEAIDVAIDACRQRRMSWRCDEAAALLQKAKPFIEAAVEYCEVTGDADALEEAYRRMLK